MGPRIPSAFIASLAMALAAVALIAAGNAASGRWWASAASSTSTADPSGTRPLGDDTASPGPLSGGLGLADGEIPDGVTVFDNTYPAVANLDHALLVALRRAATDAASDNVDLVVNSGWRSPRYQEQLLKEAVAKYGSTKAAARWVATPSTSPHVSGDAVDVGPSNAEAWLSRHGDRYGLCQIYANEPWHYELRLAAVSHGCPARYADPTLDPRMQ